jgi:hypothetical protein
MARKCVYFVSWENDPLSVKIGYSASLSKRLRELCTANCHRLMVKKILSAPNGKEDEAMLHEKFAALRITGEWFRLNHALVSFLQQESDVLLRTMGGSLINNRISLAPVVNLQEPWQPSRSLANGIKHCRHYILWMISESMTNGEKISPALLINHPLNAGRFASKTIYNELCSLKEREMVNDHLDHGLLLTIFGINELERRNAKIK